VKYDESQKPQLNKHQILAVRDLLQPLYALQSNLCFKKRTLECALRHVAANKPDWALTKEMEKDFVETVTKRLMNILKHCSHALRKQKRPGWAHCLLHPCTKPAQNSPQASAPAASCVVPVTPSSAGDSVPAEYFVGWNPELNAAWRCEKGTPTAKTYTKNIVSQDSDLEPAIAIWEDGYKHPLAELTSLAWSQMQSTEKECTKAKEKMINHIIFHIMSSGGAPITVKNRQDRSPIDVIYEGKRQTLQVTVRETSRRIIYKEVAVTIAKSTARRT
jgi:hypothetical protein